MDLIAVTPKKKIFEGKVLSVLARGEEGDFEILPGHAPFISQLKEGDLIIKTPSETKTIKISSGFIEAHDSKITLLVKDA